MNFVDFIILVWLAAAILRGYNIGLVRQAASFIGFLLGLLGAGWVLSTFFSGVQNTGSSLLLALVIVLSFASMTAAVAEMLARRLQQSVRFNFAHMLNAWLGAVFSVAAALALAWLLLSALNRLPLAEAGLSISESRTYRTMDKILPPAPNIFGQINRIADSYGFPQIFVGDEPQGDSVPEPIAAEVEAAAAVARQSVVRIEGQACGKILTGSGFVAAPGFIMTNAHVIAGVDMPVVVRGSEKYRSVPVWFNDDLDIAVLRTEGLNGPVLPLAKSVPERGQSGAVLGYPGGGGLSVVPGVMQGRYEAMGRDIYGRGLAARPIYQIQASIQQGNSGGPFVLPDGTVAGVMFGASPNQVDASYAIASAEAAEELRQAVGSNRPVVTGDCL